ncbi:uncharacterized protein LOC143299006 [Babylonia areolata]|uniref:uncharacterized protein LOC143299006 n=1 Tax=Babylonia areolata TaxID=304850 RepID=UPI003FD00EC6
MTAATLPTGGWAGETFSSIPSVKKTDSDANPASGDVLEEVAYQMGIPYPIIKMARAIQCLEKGTDFPNACDLIEFAEELISSPEKQKKMTKKLYEAELAKKEEETKSKDLYEKKAQVKEATAAEIIVSPSAEMQKPALAEPKSSVDNKMELKERVKHLAKENHQLRQRKMCRACRKVDLATSGITFLPCGHFITCEMCSETFDDCPACGKSIMGTVRTFLS